MNLLLGSLLLSSRPLLSQCSLHYLLTKFHYSVVFMGACSFCCIGAGVICEWASNWISQQGGVELHLKTVRNWVSDQAGGSPAWSLDRIKVLEGTMNICGHMNTEGEGFFSRKSQHLPVGKRNNNEPNCLGFYPSTGENTALCRLCQWSLAQWQLWDNCLASHTRAGGSTLRGENPFILTSFGVGCP